MAKRAKKKAEERERKRVEQDAATMARVADTTFYTIMPQMMKNVTLNIERGLRHDKTVSELIEEFKPVTSDRTFILVIAAGPSLEMYGHLDILKEHYRDRGFTIVAVDAILERLCKKGIYPDYVISADVQEETANFYQVAQVKTHRKKLASAGTRGIFMGNIDPQVMEIWGDLPTYYYWPAAPFGTHMDAGTMWNLMVPLGIVNPHGHVTGAALSIFSEVDDDAVIGLIGGDYSYRPGESYEDTFWYKWIAARGRTHEEIMDNLRPEEFEDRITGETIMTDVPFMQYLSYMFNWLEARINQGRRVKLVNCTGRGLFYDKALVPYVSFYKFLEGSNG